MTRLFKSEGGPRLFGVAPGVDFPRALVEGLLARFAGQPPEALARVTLYLNTARMQRRVRALFDEGPARLLPRIRLVTDLSRESAIPLPPPVPGLRRRLQLAQLVARLLEAEPDLAPATAAFDLATSLAALMDEMQGEGVGMEALATLDVSDQSGHWARSQKFLTLVGQFLSADATAPQDAEGRQRRLIELMIRRWQDAPPADPVIVAGSTASRGATRLFMQAVARLPQGALVLPGFDFDMPAQIWAGLAGQQDHPQYRFAALAEGLGLAPAEVRPWHGTRPPSAARNALVSLALRPAPVTDGWLRDGPGLGPLAPATEAVTLIEAPDQRAEAAAIALRLRQAVEAGQQAALITPDRMLTRRVAAALDRWGILPDDSAGEPLTQSPAGRLYLQAAGLLGRQLTAEALLILLKHPLVHAGRGRGQHLLLTRELELDLRRNGPPFPVAEDLLRWAELRDTRRALPPERSAVGWARWLGMLTGLDDARARPLPDLTAQLAALVQHLAEGHEPNDGSEPVWRKEDVRQARHQLDALALEAGHGGEMTPREFQALLRNVLTGEVRNPDEPHPGVMIWGTLEARVQGADLVILGGLNDGSWPEMPEPDPWLNRDMRAKAGLLLPERRIGLAAHDFQQAIAAPEVMLTRARRDAEAETVPSRWLNRLINLLDGLPEQGGRAALAAMRDRGAYWLHLAATLDRPAMAVGKAPRPSPRPPLAHRPDKLSVTDIQVLIRDPYEIYARRILRLGALDPLHKTPEPRDRGNVLHHVLERFVRERADLPENLHRTRLIELAAETLADEVPWPTARRLWLARLGRVAQHFLTEEGARAGLADPIAFERRGQIVLPDLGFTLVAKADRIDLSPEGALYVYDYKTGNPPTVPEQKKFSKQLLLEAAIAEAGGFADIAAANVLGAAYIGLGATPRTVAAPLAEISTAQTLHELRLLVAAFQSEMRGYTAQLARQSERVQGDYDQLSRAGEWDLSEPPLPEDVGR